MKKERTMIAENIKTKIVSLVYFLNTNIIKLQFSLSLFKLINLIRIYFIYLIIRIIKMKKKRNFQFLHDFIVPLNRKKKLDKKLNLVCKYLLF